MANFEISSILEPRYRSFNLVPFARIALAMTYVYNYSYNYSYVGGYISISISLFFNLSALGRMTSSPRYCLFRNSYRFDLSSCHIAALLAPRPTLAWLVPPRVCRFALPVEFGLGSGKD